MSAERSHFCVYHTPGLSPQPGGVSRWRTEKSKLFPFRCLHTAVRKPPGSSPGFLSLCTIDIWVPTTLWGRQLSWALQALKGTWHLIPQCQSRYPQSFDNQKRPQTNVSQGRRWPFFPSWQSLVFGTRKRVVTFAPDSGPSGWGHIISHLLPQTLSVPSWTRVTRIERNNVFEHVQWVRTHDKGAVTILMATKMPIALGSLCVSRSFWRQQSFSQTGVALSHTWFIVFKPCLL